jgi:serine/threonine protein kinase
MSLIGVGSKRGRSNSPSILPPILQISPSDSIASSALPSAKRRRLNKEDSLNNYVKYYENTMVGDVSFKNYISTLKKGTLPEPLTGGTSRVFIITINNVKYAMKRVNIGQYSDSLYKEIRSLSILNDNNCTCAPTLIAIAKQNEYIYLLMSYTEGKTLQDWLKTNPSTPEKQQRLDELKAALDTIHSFNIIHADVKPSNIWIPSDPSTPAYFIDFGSSIEEGEKASSYTTSPNGSPLESESATKSKNIAALTRIFPVSGGGKRRYKHTRHNRKKLNRTRRHK